MMTIAKRSNQKLGNDTSINGLALLSDRPTLQTHTQGIDPCAIVQNTFLDLLAFKTLLTFLPTSARQV
jgi:hypothetical protein